jgi:hypothetical protein
MKSHQGGCLDSDSADTPVAAPRKRRWQFSLLQLLIVTTILGVVLGWVGRERLRRVRVAEYGEWTGGFARAVSELIVQSRGLEEELRRNRGILNWPFPPQLTSDWSASAYLTLTLEKYPNREAARASLIGKLSELLESKGAAIETMTTEAVDEGGVRCKWIFQALEAHGTMDLTITPYDPAEETVETTFALHIKLDGSRG